MKRQLIHYLFAVSYGLAVASVLAVEPAVPPAPDAIRKLPVTTGWLGNSLLRCGQADWKD